MAHHHYSRKPGMTPMPAPPQVVRESGSYLRGLWVRLNGGDPRSLGARSGAGLELPLPLGTAEQRKEVGPGGGTRPVWSGSGGWRPLCARSPAGQC
jgi:hypothetical protein